MIRSRNEPPEVTAGKMAERWTTQKADIKALLESPEVAVNANWQNLSAAIWAYMDGRVLGDWQDRPVRGWTAEHIHAPFDICMVDDLGGKTLKNGDLAISAITTLLPGSGLKIAKHATPGGPWEVMIDSRFDVAAKFHGMTWGFAPGMAVAAWRAYFSYINKEPNDV